MSDLTPSSSAPLRAPASERPFPSWRSPLCASSKTSVSQTLEMEGKRSHVDEEKLKEKEPREMSEGRPRSERGRLTSTSFSMAMAFMCATNEAKSPKSPLELGSGAVACRRGRSATPVRRWQVASHLLVPTEPSVGVLQASTCQIWSQGEREDATDCRVKEVDVAVGTREVQLGFS